MFQNFGGKQGGEEGGVESATGWPQSHEIWGGGKRKLVGEG